jgi:cytochrome b
MTASFEPSTPRAGPHGAGAAGTRIWDLPTRLFHWVLTLNLVGQVAAGGRAHPDHWIGHSPLGALSVFAMLGILVIQVSTGLVADDELVLFALCAIFAAWIASLRA